MSGFETVLKTIDRALELGVSPLKLNCVVIKDLNDAEVLDFVELTKDKPIEVRFIEFMPFDGTFFSPFEYSSNIQEINGISQKSYQHSRYSNVFENVIPISSRYLLFQEKRQKHIISRLLIWAAWALSPA